MKLSIFVTAIVAASTFTFAGCANQSSNTAAAAGDPTKRTYTDEDLNKTGRQNTGEALRALDPSVQTSGGR
jgi:predicted small secreted protein